MTDETGKQLVEGDVTVTSILSDKRQINIRTHLYVGEDQAVRNFRVDAMMDIVDRQLVRSDIIAKQAEIAQHDASETALAEHFADVLAKQQADQRLTSTEKQTLADFEKKKQWLRDRRDSAQAAIAAANHKLNGSATQ
jgi:hypothetical protein